MFAGLQESLLQVGDNVTGKIEYPQTDFCVLSQMEAHLSFTVERIWIVRVESRYRWHSRHSNLRAALR